MLLLIKVVRNSCSNISKGLHIVDPTFCTALPPMTEASEARSIAWNAPLEASPKPFVQGYFLHNLVKVFNVVDVVDVVDVVNVNGANVVRCRWWRRCRCLKSIRGRSLNFSRGQNKFDSRENDPGTKKWRRDVWQTRDFAEKKFPPQKKIKLQNKLTQCRPIGLT